jgi:hypothetical protein
VAHELNRSQIRDGVRDLRIVAFLLRLLLREKRCLSLLQVARRVRLESAAAQCRRYLRRISAQKNG